MLLQEELKDQEDQIPTNTNNEELKSHDEKKQKENQFPLFINSKDILQDNQAMLDQMGDIEKRNKEFEELSYQAQVDQKYLWYEREDDYMIDAPNDLDIEGDVKMGTLGSKNDMYHHRVVKLVESYYEDKYNDLENKRTVHQPQFERDYAMDIVKDMNYHLGDDKN